MNVLLLSVICAILSIELSMQASTPASSSYIAGVVEFARSPKLDPHYTRDNTKQFLDIIKSEATQNVDILVFPEAVLNGVTQSVFVPPASLKEIPCLSEEAAPLLRDISCSARNTSKYVVINIYMKTNCSQEAIKTNDSRPCTVPAKDLNIYNTAVVFNRDGAIIAVYRKYNLFSEPEVRKPLRPDVVTFTTDFGVTFGVFICFDLTFAQPVLQMIEDGIKHFVFPTYWFSETPYLTALQIQQSWAQAHNVNLLAAGGSTPSDGVSGSGIYSGKLGALSALIAHSPTTAILTAEVPKIPGELLTQSSNNTSDNKLNSQDSPNESNEFSSRDSLQNSQELQGLQNSSNQSHGTKKINFMSELQQHVNVKSRSPALEISRGQVHSLTTRKDNFGLLVYQENMSEFNISILDFSKNTTQAGTFCQNSVCCNYQVTVNDHGAQPNKRYYSYAIAMHRGHRSYVTETSVRTGQIICSLIACTKPNEVQSCGLILTDEEQTERYTLQSVKLLFELPTFGVVPMPSTLRNTLLPLKPEFFFFKNERLDKMSKSLNTANSMKNSKYVTSMELLVPRSDILTFGIYAKEFYADMFASGDRAIGGIILMMACTIFSVICAIRLC